MTLHLWRRRMRMQLSEPAGEGDLHIRVQGRLIAEEDHLVIDERAADDLKASGVRSARSRPLISAPMAGVSGVI